MYVIYVYIVCTIFRSVLAAVEFVVFIMCGSFMGYLWFIFDDASKVNNTHALLLFSMSVSSILK